VLRIARDDLIAQRPLVARLQLDQLRGRAVVGRCLARPGLERTVCQGHGAGRERRLRDSSEGSTLFIDNLAIPIDARNVPLAHRFIDFTMEPEIAAEICRTMKYSSPNGRHGRCCRTASGTTRRSSRRRTCGRGWSLVEDAGEATVLYDRLWTEVKSR